MSVLNENTIIGASAAGGDYEIDNSLRFNGLSEARLSRTPSSASNQKTWTWSAWVKLGKGYSGGSGGDLFYGGLSNSTMAKLQFNDGDYGTKDSLWMSFDGGSGYLSENTTALFRDPNAWYHIVWVLDTTVSTATDRVKLYVNGERLTSFTSVFGASSFNNIGQNSNWGVNSAVAHSIGGTNNFFDGYLAEVNLVDGLALTPDSFGETGDYGEWKAKSYAGGYGTNGFYLDFKSSGSLGNDSAGSNNWTIHNLAATDQMLDSPTNNFCTMNPLRDLAAVAYSEGNCWSALPAGDNNNGATGTFAPSSGKWYWEATSTHTPTNFGIAASDAAESELHYSGSGMTNYYLHTGIKWVSGSNSAYGASGSVGDIIGTALDMDNRTIQFFKNGSSLGAAFTIAAGANMAPACFGANVNNVKTVRWNFGADSSFAGNKTPQGNQDANSVGDFFYPVPSGFLALCTANLPSVDVIPSEHFNTVLYTGTGSSNAISNLGLTPDFTWIKSRSNTEGHGLVDSVRGATKLLSSNTTDSEATSANYVASLDSDGFTVGTSTLTNGNGYTYVAWNWKAGGSAVSNTNGTITSQVSANPSAGFSIVTYTGSGSAGTVGHGLSKIPDLIITKGRSNSGNWVTWHKDLTGAFDSNGGYMYLNSTGVAATTTVFYDGTGFTSSVFKWRGGNENVNQSSRTYLSYCFNNVDGFLKTGTYGGNGSTNGPFVHCGFKPAFLILRNIGGGGEWIMQDDARQTFNADAAYNLSANRSVEENNGTYVGGPTNANNVDWLSNGFKIRADNGNCNAVGGTFLFIAFAESPFKHTNAR